MQTPIKEIIPDLEHLPSELFHFSDEAKLSRIISQLRSPDLAMMKSASTALENMLIRPETNLDTIKELVAICIDRLSINDPALQKSLLNHLHRLSGQYIGPRITLTIPTIAKLLELSKHSDLHLQTLAITLLLFLHNHHQIKEKTILEQFKQRLDDVSKSEVSRLKIRLLINAYRLHHHIAKTQDSRLLPTLTIFQPSIFLQIDNLDVATFNLLISQFIQALDIDEPFIKKITICNLYLLIPACTNPHQPFDLVLPKLVELLNHTDFNIRLITAEILIIYAKKYPEQKTKIWAHVERKLKELLEGPNLSNRAISLAISLHFPEMREKNGKTSEVMIDFLGNKLKQAKDDAIKNTCGLLLSLFSYGDEMIKSKLSNLYSREIFSHLVY